MGVSVREKEVFVFGPFRMDPMRRTLLNGSQMVPLTGRLFETLHYFVRNPGRVVERIELQNAVWRGRTVEDGNLQKAVSDLRRALQETHPEGQYIVTVPGRGFQFVALVRCDETVAGEGPAAGPIALAKLSPPKLPATIPRTRLFAALDRLIQRNIVWVMAPPGAGKTTLVCSYRDHAQPGGIWYVVDSGDGDPASFFYYLREAALHLPGNAAPLPMLTAEYASDLPAFTRRFFRALSTRLPHGAALVLDNYQEAPEASPLAAILRDATPELGGGRSLIVISRCEPPQVLARLRANQDLGMLAWEDLRFTQEEVGEIVLRWEPAMSARAPELHLRSGGWAAGLTLLLATRERMGNGQDASSAETTQALFDYFASELFEQASELVRLVWIATAYLPRFTSRDAVTLSGRDDAEQALEMLARRRTFTDRLSVGTIQYQYHALFAAFLQHHADRTLPHAARLELIHKSAVLAAQAGEIASALVLYRRAGDWIEAERLLLNSAEELFAQGRWQTLYGWLQEQLAHGVERPPWFDYWLTLCEGQVDPQSARANMERVYKRFVEAGDRTGQALSVCAVVDGYLLAWNNLETAQIWVQVLESIIRHQSPLPSLALELRVHSAFLAVSAHLQPPYDLLVAVLRRVWELCGEDLPAGDRLAAASSLVLFLGMGASSAMAQAAIRQFDPLAELAAVTPLQRCNWHFSKNFGYACAADFANWALAWRNARQIAAGAGLNVLRSWFRTLEVWLPLCESRLEDAAALLREWRLELADTTDPFTVAHYHMSEAWLALLHDDSISALAHMQYPMELALQLRPSVRGMIVRNLHAHALAQCGHLEEALEFASLTTSFFESTADGVIRLGSYLTKADILLRLGRQGDALVALSDGFATGRRGGHYNTIPWLPKMMKQLSALALREGIEREYVEELGVHRGLM